MIQKQEVWENNNFCNTWGKEMFMEEHTIISERLEDQLKAVEWARAEQKRILKEKGERLSKELMDKMTPFILAQRKK